MGKEKALYPSYRLKNCANGYQIMDGYEKKWSIDMKNEILFGLVGVVLTGLMVAGCGKVSQTDAEKGKGEVAIAQPVGECISANCVVTFFNDDGSRYITSQQHRIYPSDSWIIISSSEPAGEFVCQFSSDGFNITSSLSGSRGGGQTQTMHGDTTQLVLAAFSAGSGLIEDLKEVGKPEKISGRLYQPMQSQSYCQEQICLAFYRNINSGVVDIVRFEDGNSARYLFCRSFNYQKITGVARPVPTKIDIFNTDKAGLLQGQLLQMEYYGVKKL